MILASFGYALEILVDPFRLKKQGMLEVTSYSICDVVIHAVGSFRRHRRRN